MDLTQLAAGGGLIGGVIVVAVVAPKMWTPARRLVALIDTLAGRPARYPGDPEARPGLAERLDVIERHVGNGSSTPLRQVVDELRDDLADLRRCVGLDCSQPPAGGESP